MELLRRNRAATAHMRLRDTLRARRKLRSTQAMTQAATRTPIPNLRNQLRILHSKQDEARIPHLVKRMTGRHMDCDTRTRCMILTS